MSLTLLTKVDKARVFCGYPHEYKDVTLIYPARMDEVLTMGPDNFKRLLYHITMDPKQLDAKIDDISSLDFFIARHNIPSFARMTSQAMRLFLKEEILIIPEANVFALGGSLDEEKFKTLTAEEFNDLQSIIRELHWVEPVRAVAKNVDVQKYNEIAAKLAQGRAQVAKIKRIETEWSFVDMISSALLLIPNLSYDSILNMTYYAFLDMWRRAQNREDYETSLKYALAGAKIPKDRLKTWIRPLEIGG